MILLQDNINHWANTAMNYKKVIYFVLIGESDQHKKWSGYKHYVYGFACLTPLWVLFQLQVTAQTG